MMKLKLNSDIDTDFVRFKVQRKFDKAPHPFKTFEEFLVDVYIHEHSNYERVMWSFWKRSKGYCLKEMSNLLVEISTIDKDLTWQCIETLKRYETTYKEHHKRSRLVQSDNSMSLVRRVA